ncbi:MAG: VCBS repeat-containing protein [Planctomycetes bacterium]|nr:VCBS repeat-containing protein [Planctomycetota bacterium]
MTISRGIGHRLLLLLAAGAVSVSAQDAVAPYLDLGPSRGIGFDPGDVNGDGFGDVLVVSVAPATVSNPQHAYLLRGSDGVVILDLAPTMPGAPSFTSGVGVADLNGDGYRDLLLSVGSAIEVRSGLDGAVLAILPPPTLLLPGSGLITALSTGASIVNAGDLNGDGGEEFIVPAWFGGGFVGVVVYSAPSFQVLYSFGPAYGTGLGSANGGLQDVDGDGIRDFFVGGGLATGGLGIYSGATGSLLFTIVGALSGACGMDDVNGDGLPEMALMEFAGSPAVQIRVISLPSLATLYTIPGGVVPMRIQDADGDGINDLLVRGGAPGGVGVFSGTTGALIGSSAGYGAAPFGDVNGDGLGDFGTNFGVNLPYGVPQAGAATSLMWPGLMAPPAIQFGIQAMIYVARNLELAAPVLVGGTATLDLVVPKHANRPFGILFSLEGAFPGAPVGPFYFPLVNDALLQASLAAAIGGVLGASGTASITVPVPSNPALQGLEVLASGVVLDPSGPLGIGCVLTGLSFAIQ